MPTRGEFTSATGDETVPVNDALRAPAPPAGPAASGAGDVDGQPGWGGVYGRRAQGCTVSATARPSQGSSTLVKRSPAAVISQV